MGVRSQVAYALHEVSCGCIRLRSTPLVKVFLLALLVAAPALAQSPDEVAQRIHLVRTHATVQNAALSESAEVSLIGANTDGDMPSSGRITRVAVGGWFKGAAVGAGIGAVVGYAVSSDDDFLGREGSAIVLAIVGAAAGGAVGAPLAARRIGAKGTALALVLSFAVPLAIVDSIDNTGGGGLDLILLYPVTAVGATVLVDKILR